jgi:hypothetical protein
LEQFFNGKIGLIKMTLSPADREMILTALASHQAKLKQEGKGSLSYYELWQKVYHADQPYTPENDV